jgi:hypothetical protein
MRVTRDTKSARGAGKRYSRSRGKWGGGRCDRGWGGGVCVCGRHSNAPQPRRPWKQPSFRQQCGSSGGREPQLPGKGAQINSGKERYNQWGGGGEPKAAAGTSLLWQLNEPYVQRSTGCCLNDTEKGRPQRLVAGSSGQGREKSTSMSRTYLHEDIVWVQAQVRVQAQAQPHDHAAMQPRSHRDPVAKGTGNREQGTGNREQGAGNRHRRRVHTTTDARNATWWPNNKTRASALTGTRCLPWLQGRHSRPPCGSRGHDHLMAHGAHAS